LLPLISVKENSRFLREDSPDRNSTMRLRLISCELFERELEGVIARSRNEIQLELLPTNLHQLTPHEMLLGIQFMIQETDRARFQACLLVCGTCQGSLAGLRAENVPIVLPRTRSCLGLLMEQPATIAGIGQPAEHAFLGNLERRNLPQSAGANNMVYWMAPAAPASRPRRAPHRQRSPLVSWKNSSHKARMKWTEERLDRKQLDHGSTSRRTANLLELLADGYWSHDKLLVIPVGCRLAQTPGGMAAEEAPL
jgi:hypothetical protein